MFTQLSALLTQKSDTITITISRENDTKLRLCVIPNLSGLDKDDEARKALCKPLTMVATPQEFESAEFIESLTRYSQSASSLRASFEEAEAELSKAKTKVESKKSGSKPQDKPAAKSDTKTQPKTETKPKAEPAENKPKTEEKPAPATAEDKTSTLL